MIINFFNALPFQRLLPPNGLLSWVVWLFLVAVVVWLLWRLRPAKFDWTRKEWGWFLLLALLTPISILLLSIQLPADNVLPIPALGPPAFAPLLPLFAAVPWVLAIALLGAVPGTVLAGLSGVLIALWDTRSPFTPIEFALLAALFAAALAQPYRTRFFGWLRNPLVAALILAIIYPLLYLSTAFFWAANGPVASLDFALSRLPWVTLAVGLPLLLAGGLLQGLRTRWPIFASASQAAQPAPGERSLEARLLFSLGPIVLLAFLAVGALGWWSAGRAAEQLLSERVSSSAELAADSVPFLLETGQNLILQLAGDTRLAEAAPEDALSLLQSHLRTFPYFEQFVLLDTGGNTIAATPVGDFAGLQPGQEEIAAVGLAIQGVALQYLSVPPITPDSDTAQLSFLAAVRNSNGQVRAVLLGRTSLASNPFAQPILQSLRSVNELGGQGLLVDGESRIVIAPEASALLQPYNGRVGDGPFEYEDASPDGARRIVNYQPVTGTDWAVVAQWPARLSQELALEIALPQLLVLLALALLAYFLLRFSLRSMTGSLQELVAETRRIAAGDLKAPLLVRSADEIGRLAAAFEKMRQTLQARLEENQRLLAVSQGVSSNLDVGAHIEPILEAALASGATTARLVFSSDADGKELVGFGRGASKSAHHSLDEQMLALTQKQERVLITNPARARLKVAKGAILPQALAAFALQNKGENLGVLWLAYEQPQSFGPEAVRYLETLADQAATAAVNARLYDSASSGRQRLEAILEGTPDPLLVVDETERIVFANRAALEALGRKSEDVLSSTFGKVFSEPELLSLLRDSATARAGVDLKMGAHNYHAVVSTVEEKGRPVGRALMLRDISSFKQVEDARAEFLSTLSHDLHDPLELTRGYLNMLAMVGELNEQQSSYVQKIEHNIEGISQLAADLLDIERISSSQGLQIQSFPIDSLLQEVCDEIAPRARQKKIEIKLQRNGSGQPALEADRTLLQRVFYNLMDNAIKFSPRDGAVEVKTSFVKDSVTVSVTDHGAGIAPLDLPKAFETDPKKRRGASGLAIVKSIVERHGGRVWAESELGTGSTFYCELPLGGAAK